jgi:hypothetical protein
MDKNYDCMYDERSYREEPEPEEEQDEQEYDYVPPWEMEW